MVSWPLEVDALDAHSCDTETLWSVKCRLWVLTQGPGKTSQLIGHNREEPWPSTSKQEKRSWHKPPQRGGPAESFVLALSNRQHTHATLSTRTAIHASVFTVIVADAPAKHSTRVLYSWSTLTDGGLLYVIPELGAFSRRRNAYLQTCFISKLAPALWLVILTGFTLLLAYGWRARRLNWPIRIQWAGKSLVSWHQVNKPEKALKSSFFSHWKWN